jgi:spore maturation protein A
MLNYIWLSLIVIGIGVAVWSDSSDLSTNKFHNGQEVVVAIHPGPGSQATKELRQMHACLISVSPRDYNAAYGTVISDTIVQKGELQQTGFNGVVHVFVDEQTPRLWKDIFAAQKNPDYLVAHVTLVLPSDVAGEPLNDQALLKFDPVKFVSLNAVTNDGIIKYAKTAVELAIGLIGIMALWLGLMKIAEQSGLVANIARALRPVTTRLFPDVPADHPAMGAMIMNISANMLGLSNAATPLGLKAMEELNKLNKKLGTASDAMCTFLVINTSNVQLIPATTIAIRAASGSANPTEILGPVIVATVLTWIIGVSTVKLLAKLPFYKNQLR